MYQLISPHLEIFIEERLKVSLKVKKIYTRLLALTYNCQSMSLFSSTTNFSSNERNKFDGWAMAVESEEGMCHRLLLVLRKRIKAQVGLHHGRTSARGGVQQTLVGYIWPEVEITREVS